MDRLSYKIIVSSSKATVSAIQKAQYSILFSASTMSAMRYTDLLRGSNAVIVHRYAIVRLSWRDVFKVTKVFVLRRIAQETGFPKFCKMFRRIMYSMFQYCR